MQGHIFNATVKTDVSCRFECSQRSMNSYIKGVSDAIDLLVDLVRTPSINPMGRTDIPTDLLFEHRVADVLEAALKSAHATYTRHTIAPGRDNIIATYTPIESTGTLLYEAHMDTVPVDGMIIDPFAATIRGGMLFGRGACDVKAGVAAMMCAFLRIVRLAPRRSKTLIAAFTVDEEHTFLGVQNLIDRKVMADFAVVAEPTSLDIVTAHKGVARWTTTVAGTACHSSRPSEGVNAIYRMARLLAVIEAEAEQLAARPPHPTLGPATLSVGVIHGGVSPNTVPDACRIEVDRRLLPGESAVNALDEFEAAVRSAALPFEATSTLTFACPPLAESAAARGHIDALMRSIRTVGHEPRCVSVPFGTDASSLSEAGIPSVVFGPGSIAQAHTKDEWVSLKEVEYAADILTQFVIETGSL
jgi:acetylornithine deacetylase/succinyl-diaminopimelate desuccinylase-like protein